MYYNFMIWYDLLWILKWKESSIIRERIRNLIYIQRASRTLFLNLLFHRQQGRWQLWIFHLECLIIPKYWEEKFQSWGRFRMVRFFPFIDLSLSLNFRSLSTTCLLLRDDIFARIAFVRFPVLLDRYIAVHVRVLLHVVAPLPRFSRRFDAATNKRELPFLLR